MVWYMFSYDACQILRLSSLFFTYRRRLRVWLEPEVRSEEVPQMPEVGHAVPCELSDAETTADDNAIFGS